MPERELSETEISNILDKDFKIKTINTLIEVQKSIQELRNKFKSEIQSLRNSISERKHTMEGFKSRLDVVEEMVNGTKLEKRNTKKLRHREKKGSLRMKEY